MNLPSTSGQTRFRSPHPSLVAGRARLDAVHHWSVSRERRQGENCKARRLNLAHGRTAARSEATGRAPCSVHQDGERFQFTAAAQSHQMSWRLRFSVFPRGDVAAHDDLPRSRGGDYGGQAEGDRVQWRAPHRRSAPVHWQPDRRILPRRPRGDTLLRRSSSRRLRLDAFTAPCVEGLDPIGARHPVRRDVTGVQDQRRGRFRQAEQFVAK